MIKTLLTVAAFAVALSATPSLAAAKMKHHAMAKHHVAMCGKAHHRHACHHMMHHHHKMMMKKK